ncbi:MAG: adenosylcobinamide-GDP ribazoletransferase [Pseudomonadota bacterium]
MRGLIQLGDVAAALMLLTRVPIAWSGTPRGREAAWAWPVAGLVVGAIAAGGGALAVAIGLPSGLAAGVTLALAVVLTGALHEDGLADIADGFWGGRDTDTRLEIMRDSRIGSYGVSALILCFGFRWLALGYLVEAGAWGAIIAAAVLSRAPMAAVMRVLPPARADGLSRLVGRPAWRHVAVGGILAVGLAFGLAGWAGPAAALAAAVAAGCIGLVAWRKIKGQTGDVLGAVQQVAEVAVLAVLVTLG